MASKPTDYAADGVLNAVGVLRRTLKLNPDALYIELMPEHAQELLDIIDELRDPARDHEG